MKLSIFTTLTEPVLRGDNYKDALKCYAELADELIVVDGSGDKQHPDDITLGDIHIYHKWPQEFDWPLIGQQFQRGYEACTGDWVIRADLDFIFHERDFENIRKTLEDNKNEPGLSFYKYQFILPDRYNLKSRVVLAVNKKLCGDRIRFNAGGDQCQPSLDNDFLNPHYAVESRIPFYNYEKLTKTSSQVMADCGRMDRAYFRHFGSYQLSVDGTDEGAFDGYMRLIQARLKKEHAHIKLSEHPKFIQEIIKSLNHNQLGYNLFGLTEVADYFA